MLLSWVIDAECMACEACVACAVCAACVDHARGPQARTAAVEPHAPPATVAAGSYCDVDPTTNSDKKKTRFRIIIIRQHLYRLHYRCTLFKYSPNKNLLL